MPQGARAPERKSRLQALREQGREVVMPSVPAPYLVDWWIELGAAGPEGPLAWQEIAAWERYHGPLQGWEALTLRSMSEAYVSGRDKGRDPDCPAPFAPAESQAEIDARVTRQFEAMLQAIAAGKAGSDQPKA